VWPAGQAGSWFSSALAACCLASSWTGFPSPSVRPLFCYLLTPEDYVATFHVSATAGALGGRAACEHGTSSSTVREPALLGSAAVL
jgi:hypothetical protein